VGAERERRRAGRKSWLLPDVQCADEFSAAEIPALATRPAPNNSSQNADRIALFAGNADFRFTQRQVKAVQETDSSFGHVSAKGGELASVNADSDRPKERTPRLYASTVALCGFLRLDNQSVNCVAKPSVLLRNVRHSVQAPFSAGETGKM
jgi:hypothetical protein